MCMYTCTLVHNHCIIQKKEQTYRGFQVWGELIELVDRSDVDAAGVLVHHEVVELWPLIFCQPLEVFEMIHNVSCVRL